MKVSYHHRVRMRSVGGTQEVVRVPNIGNPISHRLIDRFFQCSLSDSNGHHRCTEKLHPSDIQRLSLHVYLSHIDDAFETEASRHGRGRYSMLPGAGLGDQSLFAHSDR